MENPGEYVMFSKGTFLLDTPSEKLKQKLEEELKLSSDNIQSHGWYHGRIPWEVSESLVLQDGDFLIRDSLTSLGDYVLTSSWKQKVLHFLIRKVTLQSSDSYVQMQYLLEGETFDSVPALVNFYMGNQAPLTKESGTYIFSPVNRTFPLDYLDTVFGQICQKGMKINSPTCRKESMTKRNSTTVSEVLAVELMNPQRETVKTFAGSLEQRVVVSQSPTPLNTLYRRKRSPSRNRKFVVVPSSPVWQRSSETNLCTSASNAITFLENPANLWPSLSQSFQSPSAEISDLQYNSSICPAMLAYTEPSPSEEVDQSIGSFMEDENEDYLMPLMVDTGSNFRPTLYKSPLLPEENKPLEKRILRRIKEVLTDTDTKTLAMHMTKVDCMVAQILDVANEKTRGMGVSSGIELLTLPHGHYLRQDLLERIHTMSIMLAVELLGCTGNMEERGAALHRIISLASELKNNLGNMFGFASVMRVLELPQIVRLDETWMALRQKYTETAVLYEKTLRPSLKRMNEGKEICDPLKTMVPHLLPLLLLFEKNTVTLEGSETWENLDTGVDSVLCHLETARAVACHGEAFYSNAKSKLQGYEENPDILEVFLTEFQMRLLWGSRGAEESREERYEKFDKVLTALSNRLEPPQLPQ